MCRIVSICFLLFLCALHASAQQQVTQHFTSRDGLTSNTIYNVSQDRKGFIWFCTDLGLSRFDGHSFQNFTSREGIPDNEVFNMVEDRYGRHWLWLYNHKTCYIFNDKVYTAANDKLCRQIDASGINYDNMFFNVNGAFCLGGKHICIVHRDSITFYYPELTLVSSTFYYFLHNGAEYIVDARNLYQISNGRKKIISSVTGTFMIPFYHDGHLYLLNQITLNRYFWVDITLNKEGIISKQIPASLRIYNFTYYKGRIWSCSEKGVIPYDALLGQKDTAITELSGIGVNKLFKDREDNYWYTTLNDGVYLRAPSMPLLHNKGTGLPGNNVLALAIMPSGSLIAGFDNGLVTVTDDGKTMTIPLQGKARVNRIRYIRVINDHEVAAGTDNGLFRINISKGSSRPFSLYYYSAADKAGYMRGDSFYFGGVNTAGCYDLHAEKAVKFFWQKTTTAILEDHQKTLWLGSLDGLYFYKDAQIYKFSEDSVLAHCRITSLALLGKDGLVISTHQNGIFIWQQGKLHRLTEGNGISSNICRKMVIDNTYLWICTNRGLDKVLLQDGRVKQAYHFSQPDGFFTNNINDVAFGNGKIYIATSDGILILNRDHFVKTLAPKIYILSVRAKNVEVNYPGSIALTYRQNNIQVIYTGVSVSDGKEINYKYFLAGGGGDTSYTTLSSLNLSAIKSGVYTLYLWAGNKNRQWSTPAIFTFTIRQPIWEQYWFMFSMAAIVTGCFYFLFRRRINSISLREKEKTNQARKMAALEMQTLRAQINPHFIFNALNAIQHYYSENDERSANYYMTSFARLIRQTLNNAQIHWLTVTEEITMLHTYLELEQMRFNHSFEYEMKADNVPGTTLVPAMLLQPYVENAINHGLRYLENEKGQLRIVFDLREDHLYCRIEDNGVGFYRSRKLDSSSENHKSLGMSITQQRIETINQLYSTNITVSITDKQSSEVDRHGTIIEIVIPLIARS